jgi:hypothetical protein
METDRFLFIFFSPLVFSYLQCIKPCLRPEEQPFNVWLKIQQRRLTVIPVLSLLMGINPENDQHRDQANPEQSHASSKQKTGGYHFAG